MLTGTIINALAILAGSAVGLGIHALAGRFSAVLGAKGIRLGERLQTIMMQGISLCVLYVGVTGSLKGQNTLVAILSMVAGGLGVSVLSAFSLAGYEGQVRVIPLTQPVSRRLGVAVKAPPAANTAARYFLSFLKRQYAGA